MTSRLELRTQAAASPPAIAVVQSGVVHRVLKRGLDVVLSSVMLVLTAPILIAISIAIWLDGGGPVLYRQRRWGRLGKPLTVLKFRSMIINDASDVPLQAVEHDLRATRVGRVLRRFGLDELPQLVNILKGDMSFVGPRALAVGEVLTMPSGERATYESVAGFWERLAVRPGLTGLATIYLPKDAPPAEKFRYDIAYAARQSVWLDLKLIALSFWISFRGKWETRARKI